MSFKPNYRARVYRTWAEAARDARTWGQQTGRKHRVSRVLSGVYLVRPTTKRATVRRVEITISPVLDVIERFAPTGIINAPGIRIVERS